MVCLKLEKKKFVMAALLTGAKKKVPFENLFVNQTLIKIFSL